MLETPRKTRCHELLVLGAHGVLQGLGVNQVHIFLGVTVHPSC